MPGEAILSNENAENPWAAGDSPRPRLQFAADHRTTACGEGLASGRFSWHKRSSAGLGSSGGRDSEPPAQVPDHHSRLCRHRASAVMTQCVQQM